MEKFYYVYRLISMDHPNKAYVGLTEHLAARLVKHNEGGVPSTAPYKPWIIDSAHAFRIREKATAFERDLKTGSGREFTRRHF